MKSIIIIVISFFLTSCSIEESPIDYGKDACHYCKMNIVDKQHSSEIVTSKGKAYKYDAIECMVNDLYERDENEIALFFVADYTQPGKLVDAKTATYLISESISSPMGANLTGFKNISDAKKIAEEKGGNIYSWNELKLVFKK